MKEYYAEIDLGRKETFDSMNGKFLDSTSYDKVYQSDEDIVVYKAGKSLDGKGIPLAFVITNAFPDDKVRKTLMSIEDTSTMR